MHKMKPSLILLFCIAATLAIGFGKFFSPNLIYFNTGFLLIILLTIFLKHDVYTYVFASLALSIIMVTYLQREDWLKSVVLIPQLLGFAMAFLTTLVVLHIKRLYREIESERLQMKVLFQFAAEGIVLCDRGGTIRLVNPEVQRLFSYEDDEMIGRQIQELIPETFISAEFQHQPGFQDTLSSHGLAQKRDLLGLKKDGLKFEVEVSLVNYQMNEELFVLVFITDISKRKESERRLVGQNEQMEKITRAIRQMNVELENKVTERTLILREALQELERSQMELSEALNKEKELNEIKSRFVSMASHEFRTPLSTVLSSALLISKYPKAEDHDKREKHTRRIKDSVKHLNDLLEDFLSLGKLEEGRVFTKIDDFDVKDFLNDIIDEMKSGCKAGQEIELSFDGQYAFFTDKRLLKNILINLISNAIKFSAEHQPIYIAVINSGSKLIIQVKDKGIGIPFEDMQHLFSTFYRGRNVVNIQGTGLGLHIVKRYVDMLEGQITLSSELNEGTTFNVGLPNLQEMHKAAIN